MIPRIQRGSIITAEYLNRIGNTVNELTTVPVNPPRQANRPPPPEIQNTVQGTDPPSTYTELTRTVSTVDVSGVSIERIETWTARNIDGDELKLVFNNT